MGIKKRILGLVTSLRQGGNSEFLTRLALRSAASEGAETDILLLRDLRLTFCEGCLSCVFRGGNCKKDDDVFWLYRTVGEYDGLVIASPTYLLGAPAQVKALIDRGVAALTLMPERREIPTATICVAGLPGWNHLAPPVVNQLGLLLGGRVVGSLSAYAPGPGEVLLDKELVDEVEELGRSLVVGRTTPVPLGLCPVCRLFRGVSYEGPCPFCLFDPSRPEEPHRFARESLARFVGEWMLPSRERYLAHRDAIRAAKDEVLEHKPGVLLPDRECGG